jgi:hypothetical protein
MRYVISTEFKACRKCRSARDSAEDDEIQTTRIAGLGWQKRDAVVCCRGCRSVVSRNDAMFGVDRNRTSRRHSSRRNAVTAGLMLDGLVGSKRKGLSKPLECGECFCRWEDVEEKDAWEEQPRWSVACKVYRMLARWVVLGVMEVMM